jgi:hypothetical protein
VGEKRIYVIPFPSKSLHPISHIIIMNLVLRKEKILFPFKCYQAEEAHVET